MAGLTEQEEGVNARFIMAYDTLKAKKVFRFKKDFCASIGMPVEYFSLIDKQERAVPTHYIDNLCQVFEISKDWLIYNNGPIFQDEIEHTGGTNYNSAGRNLKIGNQAGRDVSAGNNTDLEQQLKAALKEIEHLNARLKDKDQMIALLMKSQG